MWDESLLQYLFDQANAVLQESIQNKTFFAILSIAPLSRFLSEGTDMLDIQSLPSIFKTQPLLVPGIENVYVDRV